MASISPARLGWRTDSTADRRELGCPVFGGEVDSGAPTLGVVEAEHDRRYLRYFSRGGAILDIGCGEGALAQKLPLADYSRYVGIDLSRAAVDKASRLGLDKATFTTANAEVFVPEGRFDAIVFTEVLYYVSDARFIVERYVQSLNKDGVIVVTVNTNVRGGASILDTLKKHYSILDEVRIGHPDLGTLVDMRHFFGEMTGQGTATQ